MNSTSSAVFGSFRTFFWPIHRSELKKFLPMLFIISLLIFDYSILRNLKDSLVVTSQSSGAAVIPFIKVWVLLPMAVLLTIVFTKLSNRFSQEKVFYLIISGFLFFFGLFAFVLYPLRDLIHPNELADSLEHLLPIGCRGFLAMCRNWSFTLFYVMSELWGNIVLTVLFWGFANEVTRLTEAHRFYSVFTAAGNTATIIAGFSGGYFSDSTFNSALPFGRDGWEQSFMQLVALVLISGFIVMLIFRWMNKNVLNDPSFHDLHDTIAASKIKQKLSFRESFTFLSQSKYLIYIAILVVGYNLTINLVEVVWKDQLRVLYVTPVDYNKYTNNLTILVGVIALIGSLFIPKMLTRFGWTNIALVTPIVLFVTSIGFFGLYCFGDQVKGPVYALTGTTPLVLAVLFGAAQNCLSKGAKYSVFDTTKEMAFIPLDHESKLKGKAAIDGVGSRFGKSGSALIHQGLLFFLSTFAASAPYIAAILLLAIGLWIWATKRLGTQFHSVTQAAKLASKSSVGGVQEALSLR